MSTPKTQPVSISFMDEDGTESLKIWHTDFGEIVAQVYAEPEMRLDYDMARALVKGIVFILDGAGE